MDDGGAEVPAPTTSLSPASDGSIASVLAAPGDHAEVTIKVAQLLHRNITAARRPLGADDIIRDQRVLLSVLLVLESNFDLAQLEREVAELSLRPGSSSNGIVLATHSILQWRRNRFSGETPGSR